MSVISLLVPMSLMLGLGFAFFFVKAVRSGLFDDCETPAYRMLDDGDEVALATVSTAPSKQMLINKNLELQTVETKEV